MPEPDFWSRLRVARIVPVLLVYLGVSWGILLLVDLLQERLGLPEWLDPVAFVLLLLGLVMVFATAWVLSQPRTRERKAAGEVPGDWDVAPKALVGDLVMGRVPHLTWGRSLLGGLFALGLMFALAALIAFLAGASDTVEPATPPPAEERPGNPALPELQDDSRSPDSLAHRNPGNDDLSLP
jgi:hypothetical protein